MNKIIVLALLSAFSTFVEAKESSHKIYYVAANGNDNADGLSESTAWRTLEKLNNSLPAGAEARLKRGDVFYGPLKIKWGLSAKRPTVVTAFGEGADPEICLYKIAVPKITSWKNVGDCLWEIDLFDDNAVSGNPVKSGNVGFLLVDGVIHGVKLFGEQKPSKQWEFKDDLRRLTVWSAKNPAELSCDIRIAPCVEGIKFVRNAVISNLTVRGTGAHGANGVGRNMHISNCTFKEIGGSWLPGHPVPNTRYGNGVECWAGSSHILVDHCKFSDIYDVAFTMQGPNPACSWENIHMRNCEIKHCTQAFEVWAMKCKQGIGFKNCSFTQNRCIDTGYSWGYIVRPNKMVAAPLLLYAMETDVCDILVKDNTFINNRLYLIYKSGGLGCLPDGYRVEENQIVGSADKPIGNSGKPIHAQRSQTLAAKIQSSNTFTAK
jgi:hypothetical protein